eukprot:TRINITY_DN133_c0_g1_i1.p1 TRINITY_DN133_c0_g1~~TRINITY_DN133_c0_g1_i1.p1  ORF type:complete len:396 (-),score=85.65 TRINITY_DN133_c0_g1_i1:171-1238(-)
MESDHERAGKHEDYPLAQRKMPHEGERPWLRSASHASISSMYGGSGTGFVSVIVHNGESDLTTLQSEHFLLTNKRGAYTTCRSLDVNWVLLFERHVKRLAKTARLMLEAEFGEGSPQSHFPVTEYDKIYQPVFDSVYFGMTEFLRLSHLIPRQPKDAEELRMTILLCWDDVTGEPDIYTHVKRLFRRPYPPVDVSVRKFWRQNPQAKDSKWVEERREAEKVVGELINEVLLVGPEGQVFEGLTSNFFAVLVNEETGKVTVKTAGSGCLEGTVRSLVLEICEKMDIEVILEAPNVKELEDGLWTAAFITSTSRLILPIRRVFMDSDVYDLSLSETSNSLFENFLFHMRETCTRVIY